MLMALIPNPLEGRLCFLFCGGVVAVTGACLRAGAARAAREGDGRRAQSRDALESTPNQIFEVRRMTLSCRSLIAVAATALLFPAASFGDDWVGPSTGGEFNVAAHWDTGSAPGEDVISNVIGDVVVERSDDTTTGVVIVNQGATLNVTGGTHADTKSGRRNRNVVGGEGTGTVNQSGGSLNIRHMLVVGRGKNNDGTYRLTGGDLKITRSGLSFLAGKKRKGTSLEIGVSGARGHVLVSGGTLITRSGLGVGSGGVFEVSGSGAKSIGIGSHHTSDGAYYQRSGGVLRVGTSPLIPARSLSPTTRAERPQTSGRR